MKPPVFPPNRVIREGEPCCARCGSGKSTHEDGTRDHPFTTKRQSCPDCKGTPGRRWLGEMSFRCASCDGTGVKSADWVSAYDAHGYPLKAQVAAK